VEFNEPIYIGEMIVALASVNYAGTTSMEVGVKVLAQNPITGEERHTNTCYATFVALDEDSRPTRIPAVLPETDDEKRRYTAGEKRREERLAKRKKR
jgi:acyl-CoA hydrolase